MFVINHQSGGYWFMIDIQYIFSTGTYSKGNVPKLRYRAHAVKIDLDFRLYEKKISSNINLELYLVDVCHQSSIGWLLVHD